MGKVVIASPSAILTLESTLGEKRRDTVNITGAMETHIQANFLTGRNTAKVIGRKVECRIQTNIKEAIFKTRSMGTENSSGKQDQNTKATTISTSRKAMEKCIGSTVASTVDFGTTASSRVSA